MYILALDQGTTGSTAILFDELGQSIKKAYAEFPQYYPKPGWVEHDAEEIWNTSLKVMKEAMSDVDKNDVRAIGITNQRETIVIWDKVTGKPIHRAIVWQCRRTADLCTKMKKDGLEPLVKQKTGLPLDPYFSATKIRWILENTNQNNKDNILCGTIDSWLIWKLTEGRLHITDVSNASRTLLFNIHTLKWDNELLGVFNIPGQILPRVHESSGIYGKTSLFGPPIPIAGIAGDQQAALFGQGCFVKGATKNTYGTGCFLLMNTGEKPLLTNDGLITTVAWQIKGKTTYALEGSVFVAGAGVQWLRDGLGIIKNAHQTEAMALSVADTDGVYIVPAFTGLGTPHWDPNARGLMIGLTRGTTKTHIVRAMLEAMAYQTKDVLNVMEKAHGEPFNSLKTDGGASKNNFLMQFQADILQTTIQKSDITETTARGAAYLAGIATDMWDIEQLHTFQSHTQNFYPQMEAKKRDQLYHGWKKAVQRSLKWT